MGSAAVRLSPWCSRLERHGTRNRTYLTAYEAPLDGVDDALSDDAPDVEAPAFHQLRAAADTALATGDTARAAMYAYQAAMELARLSKRDTAPFFGAPNGDPAITNNAQAGSPSTVKRDSDLPFGEIESSVCTADDDHGDSSPQRNKHETPRIPDTDATRLLRRFGVLSPTFLRRHASARQDLIRRAEARRTRLQCWLDRAHPRRWRRDLEPLWTRCGYFSPST